MSGTEVRATVFIHPVHPSGEVTDSAFPHVDLFPMICVTLGADGYSDDVGGQKLPDAPENDPRPCLWRHQFLPDRIPGLTGELSYEGSAIAAGDAHTRISHA
jgi:hypothetical protein